jgi:hypothetical protein
MSSSRFSSVRFGISKKRKREEYEDNDDDFDDFDDLDNIDEVYGGPHKRRKVRNVVADSKPLLNGLVNPVQEQAEVTQNAWLNRDMFNRSHSNMAGNLKNIIPGIVTDKDKILDVRVGDPGIAFKADMQRTGVDHVRFFSPLNGIDVSKYENNFDMDQDWSFIGWVMANYAYADPGTNKVASTLQVSVSRSVINTGYGPLKEGDVVALVTPPFDNNSNEVGMKLDKEWIKMHSGCTETTRVLPKLVKITPMWILDIYRDIFYKLFIHSSDVSRMNSQKSLFPSSKWTLTSTGRSEYPLRKLRVQERLAVASHNAVCKESLSMIATLVIHGELDGTRENITIATTNRPLPEGTSKISQTKKLMDRLAYLVGYTEPGDYKKANFQLKSQRQKVTNDFIKILYYPYMYRKMKAALDIMFENTFNEELYHLFRTSKDAQVIFYDILLTRLDKTIGVITCAGDKSQQVNVDSGRPKYVI